MVCECWAENPDDRPHFHELVATFSGSLEGIAGYLDFSVAGNPPHKSGYDHLNPVQLQLKNNITAGHDHLNQLQTVMVSDAAVDVSVDNVSDCNAPVDDVTSCNVQIDDVTDCNIHVPIDEVTDDVTDCSIPVDDVTDHDTEVVIPETNEQL